MRVQTRIFTAAGAGVLMAGLAAGPALASTYTVQSGDTLSGIAARSGVSLSAIEAANHNEPKGCLKAPRRLKKTEPRPQESFPRPGLCSSTQPAFSLLRLCTVHDMG